MNPRVIRGLTFADIFLFPAFILWFIWRLQFTAGWTWMIMAAWLVVSFLAHRDTPKTLGWRADNLWPGVKQAIVIFGAMIVGLLPIGLALGAPHNIPPNLISPHRFLGYFAFCVLQQVALSSLLQNRMLEIVRQNWLASFFTGAIFAACHWPNPVLVPLTFIGGMAMAWMFGRVRSIIPLAIGQAVLGSIVFWAFPLAWHHHLRVGPGYYGF